ncbi:MAG TPA: NUDIX domain-containing protein [Chloroflexi bacterium]|jgi:isopentenyldiphosphate isomerase|nr:NUDIX domain-containing protein [Chloroflexota bacterium]
MDDMPRPVVDDCDRFLRCEAKSRIMAESLPHRTVWGMVVHPRRRVWLVQWRRPEKDVCPNLWDMSCGGHVDCVDGVPESYAEAYRRELSEELGLATRFIDLPDLPQALEVDSTDAVSVEFGHSTEYHEYPTAWGEPLLEREQVRMFLTVYAGTVGLPADAEPQALAWLTTEQIRKEILSGGHGTLGLERMLARCEAVLARFGV